MILQNFLYIYLVCNIFAFDLKFIRFDCGTGQCAVLYHGSFTWYRAGSLSCCVWPVYDIYGRRWVSHYTTTPYHAHS
jgi:hypothetical protein